MCKGCASDKPRCPFPACGEHTGAHLLPDRMVLLKVAAGLAPPTFKCDNCDDEEATPADATHWCTVCNACMCATCVQPHFTMKMLKKHLLQTVKEYIANGAAGGGGALGVHGCTVHDGRPLELYCATCAVLLCTMCAIIGHKGDSHDTGELAPMAARLKRELAEAAGPLELQLSAMDRAIKAIKVELAGVDQSQAAASAVVKSSAADLRRATVRFERRGLTAIKHVADEKRASLSTQ